MFEGYLDRSAEAIRKGRDVSRALCICQFGNDVPDFDVCFWSQVSYLQRSVFTNQHQLLDQVSLQQHCSATAGRRCGTGYAAVISTCGLKWHDNAPPLCLSSANLGHSAATISRHKAAIQIPMVSRRNQSIQMQRDDVVHRARATVEPADRRDLAYRGPDVVESNSCVVTLTR